MGTELAVYLVLKRNLQIIWKCKEFPTKWLQTHHLSLILLLKHRIRYLRIT